MAASNLGVRRHFLGTLQESHRESWCCDFHMHVLENDFVLPIRWNVSPPKSLEVRGAAYELLEDAKKTSQMSEVHMHLFENG